MRKNTKNILCLLALLILMAATVMAKPPVPPEDDKLSPNGSSLSPLPTTIDMAIHNVGNIVTTIDNHGYIGGRQYYNEPSGEWPRNSGHDYIGEIKYWMGATLPSGDTVVANTWDEFQAIPSLISGQAENSIMMSTDTETYWDYDIADTIGTGYGNPAFGWKVWDADSGAYVYRQNYSPELGGNYPGGPLAEQESHYRFNDAANGSSLMGIEITHSGLQWNYCYNEDFLFFVMEITNTSVNDYVDFAFGLYIDLDLGGPDGSGENGRLGDMVEVDSAENLAWNYDFYKWDEGWAAEPGVMGTKLLETPDDIGITSFRTGDFFLAPSTDRERYAFMTDTIFETSLPPTDQYYIQCVKGINLTAGKTVRVVWALIAGETVDDFKANAQQAQQFYDDNYVGAQPPITPLLSVRAGHEKAYLSWTDTSQTSIDPRTGEADFAGYKLYRSDDWGATWGKPDYKSTNACLDVEYDVLAQWAIEDPMDPIPHSFIDTGLHNDREYWYALVAYDLGDDSAGVVALQSGFGTAGQSANIVAVTPVDEAAGLVNIEESLVHEVPDTVEPSEGMVYPLIFDSELWDGEELTVTFSDALDATYWHLVNVTTGDTILGYQTKVTGAPGTYDIIDGLRVVVRDADPTPPTMVQTAFGGPDTTMIVTHAGELWGVTPDIFYPDGILSHRPLRPTYEFRVTGDTTLASPINDVASLNYSLPFEIWDVDANVRVTAAVYDWTLDGYDPDDLLAIARTPYDEVNDPFAVADVWPYEFAWLFSFEASSFNPTVGDVFTFEGAPMNSPDDVFRFTADAVNSSQAAAELQNIHVLPNPYFARYSGEVERTSEDNFLKFSDIPDICTIRIYTLAGDLVRTLEHTDGSGQESWDLLSTAGQQIASGTYLYHIESPYGERLGRFAVIK